MHKEPRRLAVMRHSKAESFGARDRDRDLTDQGRADATAVGAWLAGRGLSPDLALVSSATRTRSTWACVSDGAGWNGGEAGGEAKFEDGLYAGGPDTVLDLIRELDETGEEVTTLLVIGHNPTMAYLAQLLDDGDGDPDAAYQMATGYPTSAVAVFDVSDTWSDLEAGSGRLTGFHVGRG